MNKRFFFIFLVFVIGIGSFLVLKSRNQLIKAPTSEVAPISGGRASLFLKESRRFKAEIQAQSEIAKPHYSKECVEYFDSLEKLDLLNPSGTQESLSYQLLPVVPSGCKWDDEYLDRTEKEYEKECSASVTAQGIPLSQKISGECPSRLFFIRAAITRVILKDRSISSITDVHQLVDLLFAEFASGIGAQAPDFTKVKAIAEQMIDTNPNLYVAIKTAAYSDVISGLIDNSHSDLDAATKEANWEKAETALAKAENLRPGDSSLADAKDAVATRGYEADKTLAYGDALIQKRPDDGRGYFFRAYGEWKKNLKVESIRDLSRAIELDPKNSDYLKTLNEIKKPDAGEKAFSANFKFGISEKDFNE